VLFATPKKPRSGAVKAALSQTEFNDLDYLEKRNGCIQRRNYGRYQRYVRA